MDENRDLAVGSGGRVSRTGVSYQSHVPCERRSPPTLAAT